MMRRGHLAKINVAILYHQGQCKKCITRRRPRGCARDCKLGWYCTCVKWNSLVNAQATTGFRKSKGRGAVRINNHSPTLTQKKAKINPSTKPSDLITRNQKRTDFLPSTKPSDQITRNSKGPCSTYQICPVSRWWWPHLVGPVWVPSNVSFAPQTPVVVEGPQSVSRAPVSTFPIQFSTFLISSTPSVCDDWHQ